MKYPFYTCDVFTNQRFGGNPLAVVTNAEGLRSEQMQSIAREFNYSETTFVLSSDKGHDRNVRIFTPMQEIPFAGHPNVGTAFVLANIGEILLEAGKANVVFEELAGPVPVSLSHSEDELWCELKAPEMLSVGPKVPIETVAKALSLDIEEICTEHHPPVVASVGLPFVMVELNSLETLARAEAFVPEFEAIAEQGYVPDIHMYVRNNKSDSLRARMFAPMAGVPEDPATGSANAALIALLSSLEPSDGEFNWFVEQGIEMGRPSQIRGRTLKSDGKVSAVYISGTCKMVAEGKIEV